MSAIIILICVSLTVAVIFLIAFIWSVSSGQYADKYTPSVRMLFDENETPEDLKKDKSLPKNIKKL
ncbi:MAG TPA: cbb3-type cytochrome oxidase assembly protein CcoS [Ignavibacteria bacterium]|nr:cbb3-type cytochrome oxidase assembly protein CcoS [Bacteroidota bacterium]HRI84183.1 cbb3-type cytochrome oxidase assembly protein CcoS [Ignavibacteria bacterium]HRJ97979.1 cbb3-type cytochrome oxidase assembly protein CcoS [Ignavibacteria bacterium]